MNALFWMFLPYLLVALLLLSSSIFIATWYSCQTLIAPTSAPNCWRVWRTFPPKYGTRDCIWITRSMSSHSHCGPSFFFLLYFSDLVVRNLLLALHSQPEDKNFVLKEPTTFKLLSRKVMHFSFCLAMALCIPCSTDGHIQCSLCSSSSALPIYCL